MQIFPVPHLSILRSFWLLPRCTPRLPWRSASRLAFAIIQLSSDIIRTESLNIPLSISRSSSRGEKKGCGDGGNFHRYWVQGEEIMLLANWMLGPPMILWDQYVDFWPLFQFVRLLRNRTIVLTNDDTVLGFKCDVPVWPFPSTFQRFYLSMCMQSQMTLSYHNNNIITPASRS